MYAIQRNNRRIIILSTYRRLRALKTMICTLLSRRRIRVICIVGIRLVINNVNYHRLRHITYDINHHACAVITEGTKRQLRINHQRQRIGARLQARNGILRQNDLNMSNTRRLMFLRRLQIDLRPLSKILHDAHP